MYMLRLLLNDSIMQKLNVLCEKLFCYVKFCQFFFQMYIQEKVLNLNGAYLYYFFVMGLMMRKCSLKIIICFTIFFL